MINNDKEATSESVSPQAQNDILAALGALEHQISMLNNNRIVKAHNSMIRLISLQFAKGLAFGFGSVIGATLLVSFLVYLASTIEFIPILGEWINLIVQEINMPSH